MNVFTQRVNPMTGTCEWEQHDENYDYYQEIARSAFADMLHDTERNQKYYAALKDAIDKTHAIGKKANVLDIGTGTGLLSMMAVKCGADSVIACEAFQPMSQCALKIIKENHCEHDIKIISKRSTDLTVGDNGDMKQRANILVTEVFDTELIGEGALLTFTHAHRELLEAECFVVPNSGTIYAQLVESPLAQNWNKLKPIANSDGDILLKTPDQMINCAGAVAVHDIQLSQFPLHAFNVIIGPEPVLKFDWSGKSPLLFERCNVHALKAKRDGRAQMVFMWWDLNMDTEGKTILSCAPYWAHPDYPSLNRQSPNVEYKQDLVPWRDHWMQAVYYLPQEITVRENEEIALICCHDEYSLWFNLKKDLNITANDFERPVCQCGFHVANSRTRIGQMNDGTRNKKYLNALEERVHSESTCLSISDGSLISMAVLKMSAKHLYCLERNSIYRKILNNYIEYNGLTQKATVIERLEDLKISDLKEINLIFGEPNFVTSLMPWDNFYFANLLNEIRDTLSENVIIMPMKGTIKAIAVEYLDLHKIRAPLGDCEGFIMDKFDKLIQQASKKSDNPVEPQPLWEYPCKAMSKPVELLEFDFYKQFSEELPEIEGEVLIEGNGTCNGVALWVDWNLDGNRKNIISTGPLISPEIDQRISWDMHTRQGVFLMPRAKPTQPNTKLSYNVGYNKNTKNIYFNFKKIRS